MSCATLAYIPPGRLNGESFLRNLAHYKRSHPLILYSDCSDPGRIMDCKFVEIPDPTSIKLSKNRVAIHNRLFIHALEIAKSHGIKRLLYLESDCRVGRDNWDGEMFDEASRYKDMFVAGGPGIYNEKAMDGPQSMAVLGRVADYKEETGHSVPVFPSSTPRPIGCWFIMGGAAVYNAAIMADLFMGFERDAHQKAIQVPAFDLHVGMRCVQLFGAKAVNKLPFLTCSYSTYSNKLNTEKERIEMLRTGRACCVHQVKSSSECIWPSKEQTEPSHIGQTVHPVVDG